MSLFSLSGRVVRSTDVAPLAGVAVRLHGSAATLGDVAGAQALPVGRQVTWTRPLNGFAGTRWDCWTNQVQGQVPGITWDAFRDGALRHNPQLNGDGRLFKADQTYLLPEERALPPFAWTRPLSGFAGTRWECWEQQLRDRVPGLTWDGFRDGALQYNPQLNADGRLFKAERSYLLPQPDVTPQAFLQTETDAQGNYRFELGGLAGLFELQVEVDEYARAVLPVMVNGHVTQPVQLTPAAAPASTGIGGSGSVRSARPDYASLPEKARRVIDMALFMLGDDPATFDALPAHLQKMIYGARFLGDPNSFHYKDIVCADLVSVVFAGAGLDIKWGPAGPSMADYYVADGNAKLIELTDPNDWLPGDVLVYGPSFTAGRKAGHVNLYVGSFAGSDRSGRSYALPENCEVVDASMDFMSKGREVGTGIQGKTLRSYCLDKKCYTYSWVKRVRLRELAAAFGK
ncbi:MAG: hypothetical protein H7Z42_17885 [Roseiflexaceae bacterium]|nr:hypothetical protein [Roseiflexaceae bacterium]